MGSAASIGTDRSWRTSSWLFPGWLEISQMIEQLFRFRVVWRQLQSLLDCRPRKIGLLLLQVYFRQRRSNDRGIPRLQRLLQFLHRVIHLALAAVNFREPAVRGGARGVSGKHSPKFFLRGIGISRGELLPAAPQVCDGRVTRGSSVARPSPGRFDLRAKGGNIQLGLDAIEPCQGFVLRIQANRRESVWA